MITKPEAADAGHAGMLMQALGKSTQAQMSSQAQIS